MILGKDLLLAALRLRLASADRARMAAAWRLKVVCVGASQMVDFGQRWSARLRPPTASVIQIAIHGCFGNLDHRHVDGDETPYTFVTIEQLIEDFKADVRRRRAN